MFMSIQTPENPPHPELEACSLSVATQHSSTAEEAQYRGTSLIKKRAPLRPYITMPSALWKSWGGGGFL